MKYYLAVLSLIVVYCAAALVTIHARPVGNEITPPPTVLTLTPTVTERPTPMPPTDTPTPSQMPTETFPPPPTRATPTNTPQFIRLPIIMRNRSGTPTPPTPPSLP